MKLQHIQLFNFTNYDELTLTFDPKWNVITGKNGSGKTNLLDAIHYLCLSKSAFRLQDKLNVRHTKNFFIIRGEFCATKETNTICVHYQQNKKKSIQRDKIDYERISEHIGQFPCVLITPYDTDLIRGTRETRRKFFDNLISQTDRSYLEKLIIHNKLLKQRNELLKQFTEKQYFDHDLLETYDIQFIPLSRFIYQKRLQAIEVFKPIFDHYYKTLSDRQENADFIYVSDLQDEHFDITFKKAHSKDCQVQRTTRGTHRDEFKFLLNDYPIRKFGSQGQQKTFVLALKFTQYEYIKTKKSKYPILMLDDIFDKLDEDRIQKLVKLVAGNHFGQIFITDARTNRTKAFFESLDLQPKFFKID